MHEIFRGETKCFHQYGFHVSRLSVLRLSPEDMQSWIVIHGSLSEALEETTIESLLPLPAMSAITSGTPSLLP